MARRPGPAAALGSESVRGINKNNPPSLALGRPRVLFTLSAGASGVQGLGAGKRCTLLLARVLRGLISPSSLEAPGQKVGKWL